MSEGAGDVSSSGWPRVAATFVFLVLEACSAIAPNTPPAHALIDEAAGKIRDKAYYADRVDWPSAVAEAKRQVIDASLASNAYPAIDMLVRQLQDGHSSLLRPQRTREIFGKTTVDDVMIESQDLGGIVVIGVPTFVGTTAIREKTYAIRLHDQFESRSPRCGWIVDLRRNQGGNMFPMLAGLAPLLGTENLGSFVSRQAAQPWPTQAIYARTGMDRAAFEAPDLRSAHVAVLTSHWTVSSGEAVAIAFRGRPNTRSFGEMTGGKSSGNEGVRLADGSMVLVTSALMADRSGTSYGGPVTPDEMTVATFAPVQHEDAARAAATRWLREECDR